MRTPLFRRPVVSLLNQDVTSISAAPSNAPRLASGVGKYEDSISEVRCAKAGRWKTIPFDKKPALGQVPENLSHSSVKQSCHVLHNDVSRSNQANDSHHLSPESRTLPGKTGAVASETDVLAWEPAADEIDLFWVFDATNISVSVNIRPVLLQHPSAKRVYFYLPLHRPSHPLGGEIKTADTGEQ